MGCGVEPDIPAVVEHAPAAHYMVNGLHRISHIGNGMMLFTLYRLDVASDGHGECERVVEVKIQAHWTDVARMIRQSTAALARETMVMVAGPSSVM